jgi:hypothetical protein
VYGNAGGDWVDGIAGQYGVSGNFAEDPLFCERERLDVRDFLHSDSPCASGPCGLIGARPVACGESSVPGGAGALSGMEVSVFPNPARGAGKIRVRFVRPGPAGTPLRLSILDAAGRLVSTVVYGGVGGRGS